MCFAAMPKILRFVLAAAVSAASPAAVAAEQADRALQLVQEMIRGGEAQRGSTIRLVVKQGNIASFLGRDGELKREWEQATGVLIDASVMPQEDSLEFIRTSSDVDLTIARNHEYPDLVHAGLIEDLGALIARLGFRLPTEAGSGFIAPALQALDGDRLVAIPADFDIGMLYLRKDLLDDALQRERYRERFGVELRAPRTWAEYRRQVEFFDDPAKGFHGALEPRERATGWMYWLPRYLARGVPVRHLFDADMRPLIDSREGIEATRDYLATIPFSPPAIAAEHNDYSYTLPLFLQGRGYSTIITIAGAKLASSAASKIRNRVLVAGLPGVDVDGRLIRRPVIMYGNNLVMPKSAANKELAVLYALWLTDPDISRRSVGVAGGFADPYRMTHLADERIITTYSRQAIDALAGSLADACPAGTGLPGDSEYLAALSDNLWLAARGEIDAAAAMSRTAAAWEGITERYGREGQIVRWREFRGRYPGAPAATSAAAEGR